MSVMKYVTAEDVTSYLLMRNITNPTIEQLASMCNFYAEGAVTTVSNHLYELIVEGDGVSLEHGRSEGCRCASCYEWQVVDETGKVLDSAESLCNWVKR